MGPWCMSIILFILIYLRKKIGKKNEVFLKCRNGNLVMLKERVVVMLVTLLGRSMMFFRNALQSQFNTCLPVCYCHECAIVIVLYLIMMSHGTLTRPQHNQLTMPTFLLYV